MNKADLNFEDDKTKNLLLKYDFKYFISEHIASKDYSEIHEKEMFQSYEETKKELRKNKSKKKAQYYLSLEATIRRVYNGGFLPTLFGLNNLSNLSILNLYEVGEIWTHFETWQRLYRRSQVKKRTWNIITKFGSLLAIALGVIKLLETVL